jgi:acyl carrier protein
MPDPAVTQPAVTQPAVTQPAVTQPAVTQPAVAEAAGTAGVRDRLTAFVAGLLDPEQAAGFTARTPLAASGVLNSLGLARLIGFIRADLGVALPARELTGRDLGCVADIAAMVAAHMTART